MTMKTCEEGLVAYLSAKTGVTDLVADRLYPVKRPQGSGLPAITYMRLECERTKHTRGSTGLAKARIAVVAWALTYTAAKALAEAIRINIDGYQGTFGDRVAQGVFLDTDHDDYNEPQTADDIGTYLVVSEYLIAYNEPVPTL